MIFYDTYKFNKFSLFSLDLLEEGNGTDYECEITAVLKA